MPDDKQTNAELADVLKLIADDGEVFPGVPELLREAATRLREMDGERIEGWVDDTNLEEVDLWLGFYPFRPSEKWSQDANNKQMAEWRPAILILKSQEHDDNV